MSKNQTSLQVGNFYAIGLNYKKADAEIRGHFSLDETAQINLLTQAKKEGIPSLIIISTCNRTELYGIAQHPFQASCNTGNLPCQRKLSHHPSPPTSLLGHKQRQSCLCNLV